jgi:hypothetical protein
MNHKKTKNDLNRSFFVNYFKNHLINDILKIVKIKKEVST